MFCLKVNSSHALQAADEIILKEFRGTRLLAWVDSRVPDLEDLSSWADLSATLEEMRL